MTSTSAVTSNRDNAHSMDTIPNSTASSAGTKGAKIVKGKTNDTVKSGNDDPSWVLTLKNKMLFNEVSSVMLIFCILTQCSSCHIA